MKNGKRDKMKKRLDDNGERKKQKMNKQETERLKGGENEIKKNGQN